MPIFSLTWRPASSTRSTPLAECHSGSLASLTTPIAESKLGVALALYTEALLKELDATLTSEQGALIALSIAELRTRSAGVSDQTSAFSVLTKRLTGIAGREVAPTRTLELRTAAREETGLSFFPPVSSLMHAKRSGTTVFDDDAHRLRDADFVAIYW
ncbi:hypothetical protein [Tessaracoccus aquimaris]|uniref:hypothetical protein n=1 Tax=Tessaracoccus aquimaris TaxID=1332264 RepID=UPI0011AB6BFC|nr:hypothetical protein [Tessaracoccus aquimaris]